MSRCDIDLWPVDLESLWYIKHHVIKVCTTFESNRAIFGWIIDDFAISFSFMSCCDLDLWPFDLELSRFFDCHVFKLCAKFQRNRIMHRWVIDDLARLRSAILGEFLPSQQFSGVRGSNITKLDEWRRHRAAMIAQEDCFRVRISCCIFKCGRLKLEWCWKQWQFSHFLPPVKIRGGMGEISIPIVEALYTTEPPEYIWWPSTAWLRSAADW